MLDVIYLVSDKRLSAYKVSKLYSIHTHLSLLIELQMCVSSSQ